MTTIPLNIALTHTLAQNEEIISIWNEAIGLLQSVPFKVSTAQGQVYENLQFSLFASEVVELAHRQRTTEPTITLQINDKNEQLASHELMHAAGVFLQQLFLAMNCHTPGSLNLSDATFVNALDGSFQPPEMNPALLEHAVNQLQEDEWPTFNPPSFEKLWNWLNGIGFSETDSALNPSTRAAFGLLDLCIGEPECTMSDGLVIGHLLELLMDTHHDTGGFKLFRRRITTLLGVPHARKERLSEFFHLHSTILDGDFPALRPGLLYHQNQTSIKSRLNQVRPPILSAVGIMLVLIHDLANHNAKWYHFEQTPIRVGPEQEANTV